MASGATIGYTPMFHSQTSRSPLVTVHRQLEHLGGLPCIPVPVCGHDGDTVQLLPSVDGTPDPSDLGPTLFPAAQRLLKVLPPLTLPITYLFGGITLPVLELAMRWISLGCPKVLLPVRGFCKVLPHGTLGRHLRAIMHHSMWSSVYRHRQEMRSLRRRREITLRVMPAC
jgi:hypothetical protein